MDHFRTPANYRKVCGLAPAAVLDGLAEFERDLIRTPQRVKAEKVPSGAG
jgi:hypothetical protein